MISNYVGRGGGFQKLVGIVGESKAEKIIETFGGSYIYVPMKKTISKGYRNQQIYNDFVAGLSLRKISLKYNISEDRVRNIVKAMKKMSSVSADEELQHK